MDGYAMITRTTIRFLVHPSTHEELDCSLVRPRRRLGLDNNIDEQSQWGPTSAACESDACREPTSPSSRSCFDIISLSSVKTKLISGRNQLQHFARLSSSLCAPSFFFVFFVCLEKMLNGTVASNDFFNFLNGEQRVTERQCGGTTEG